MLMNQPTAKIICDSISPKGKRLTTMEVKMHRFVLAEFNTHRMFSRGSASSRAIPIKKRIEQVLTDPAMPLYWGKNQSGMSAAEEMDPTPKEVAIGQWLYARDQAVETVRMLSDLGVHKQLANRLLEPWLWHTTIVSSTEWMNFFGQRCAINPETKQPFAQPEMHALAMAMQKAFYESTPKPVNYGEWHLPYITEEDYNWANEWRYPDWIFLEKLKKISVGRSARVSYLTHDGKRDPNEDIKLADKLINAKPMHPSPLEHIATPYFEGQYKGNFEGWIQYRHSFENENIKEFTPNYKKEE
jgi:hypothetical protein